MNIDNWFGIVWAKPENSKYFILFFIALALIIYRWIRTAQILRILGKKVAGSQFLYNTSFTRITIKSILWLIGLFFIFLTLLHPSWNTKEEKVIQESRDLFVALDISRSMLAQDITPNRLEFAKQKITDLVNSLPSERIGLILFSGSSFIQCPLTRDRSAFFMYLNQIDIDTIASGTTALEQALAQALSAFKQSGTQKNKLLVIFTDGEDFSSNLASYKQEAQQQGLTIFTIGIGTEQGAPIPLVDQYGKQAGHLKDRNGNVVITKLNPGILQSLAHDLGGIFINATSDGHDLKQLIHLVQKKEKETIEERSMAQHEAQYHWFLLVSFILLSIEWLL